MRALGPLGLAVACDAMTRPALPIGINNWRSRWLVTPLWGRLHRISQIEWEDDEMIVGQGVAVCGVAGRFRMPGIFARMDLKRCPACCRALGIPQGAGAPFNAIEGEGKDA